MSVDWSKPIEAVDGNGRVVPVVSDDKPGHRGSRHVAPTLDGGWFAFRDDGTHSAVACGWRIRNVAEEVKMDDGVKFKVGDRVRCVVDTGQGEWSVKAGTIGHIKIIDRQDCLRILWDGYATDWYYSADVIEPLTDHADELAQLRAFKEQAIARYSDLGEPESDEAAAERLRDEYMYSSMDAVEFARKAIAWARANQR